MQMFQISQQMTDFLEWKFYFSRSPSHRPVKQANIFSGLPISFKWTESIDFLIRKPHFEMIVAVT